MVRIITFTVFLMLATPVSVNDLNNLTVEKVYSEIKEKIELIN